MLSMGTTFNKQVDARMVIAAGVEENIVRHAAGQWRPPLIIARFRGSAPQWETVPRRRVPN